MDDLISLSNKRLFFNPFYTLIQSKIHWDACFPEMNLMSSGIPRCGPLIMVHITPIS